MNKQAIIVLHEIYGINKFIEDMCEKFKHAGFDVFCPNLINKASFPYTESQKAYQHFICHIGFDIYKEIVNEVKQLKNKYEKVFIVGFSVGATVAWRCCENPLCDGIISCYGSRIRDYTNLTPACSTLLIFAKEDFFNVDLLIEQLKVKPHIEIFEFNAKHGFMDSFSHSFNRQESKCAEELILGFLSRYGL